MKNKKSLLILISIIVLIVISIFIINKIKISKIQYEISKIDEYKYFLYKEGDNYGVIDKEGKIIIEATYSEIVIPNLQKDVFVCYTEEEIKTLNSKNEEIFTEFEEVEAIRLVNSASTLCYEKSVLKYKNNELYGLIDFEGNIIVENIYDSIENIPSTEGKFIVCKNEKYGVINLKGTQIVKTEYDKIYTDEYYNNDVLSYQRALALHKFWKVEASIDFSNMDKCELVISGSGEGGVPRFTEEDYRKSSEYISGHSIKKGDYEKFNQRFLIHIVPVIGNIRMND